MFFFFFQAEDGIRDIGVTGVQTCALPISIKDSPENIVWVYPVGLNHKVNGIKASTENIVNIHLDNGRCLQLCSIPTQDVELVLSAIKKQAPTAVYGYSEAVKLKYMKDPNSLI